LGSRATKFTEIIAETTKEIAAQASRYLPQPSIINGVYLHRFGITQELREFVEGITITTFEDFPLQGFFLFTPFFFIVCGLGLSAMMVQLCVHELSINK